MYAAIHIDDLLDLQRDPEGWDALKVEGSFMYWVFVDLEKVIPNYPYFELTEYEAMGWKFYPVIEQGYLKFYEGSNLPDQLPNRDTIVKHPKKRRDGVVVEWPMRYKYVLTDEDKLQGIAFWKVMEPHVQRTLESQT